MKIAVSFLSIKDNIKEEVNKLDKLGIDYIHVDVMDNIFVPNKTMDIDGFKNILDGTLRPKDVHIMVSDVKKYVDDFSVLNPEYITYHYETNTNHMEMINYIKSKGIKVGLSIKPNTSVEEIKELLPYIDLVLVMSVEPGKGGQSFMESAVDKVNMLYELKKDYHYVIEVDGGINLETSKLVSNADILVVGSYITSGNYEERIESLR